MATKQPDIAGFYRGKTVVVTGVCGTVGSELLRQLAALDGVEIIGLDNNESDLFFHHEAYKSRRDVDFFVGDIRDFDTMRDRLRGVDVVFHAAALKHVELSERSPKDAIRTNILGTQNIIDAAIANDVGQVLFTSSDKAVNPTNVMGTSKLMSERLMTAAHLYGRRSATQFFSTRFGNVLGSRGSVIPLFRRQIAAGGPVTLTDPRMTRFIMTLEESVRLVMNTPVLARGGEVFVTKMPVAAIGDLAGVMVERLAPLFGHAASAIEVRTVGNRPGEKLYEELLSEEETRRAVDIGDYLVALPAMQQLDFAELAASYGAAAAVDRPYNSREEPAMSRDELATYMTRHGLLKGPAEES
jgi:FlaA1/EpsC-like NDP-sugar epimerase